MKIKLVCKKCNINIPYDKIKEKTTNRPICPLCDEYLSFEGVGELIYPTNFERKDARFLLIFIIGEILLFLLCWLLFKSAYYAMLFTCTLGGFAIFSIARAIVYKKFAWASGLGIAKCMDFDWSDD